MAAIIDTVIKLINVAMYSFWQLIPINFASGIGSFLVRIISPRYRMTTTATRRTLLHIEPDLTKNEQDSILTNMWQNIGRVWAESLIVHRLARQRLKITGQDHLTSVKSTGKPVIVTFLHIGSWEIISPVMIENNFTIHSVGERQRRKLFDSLLNQVRQINKLEVIWPDVAGIRKIYQSLKRGEALGLALDEYKNGKVMGPAFGRNLTEPSNLEFALRLAKKFNALLLPMYVSRLDGVNFELHISPPITADSLMSNDGMAKVKLDLENWRERVIRDHIDQWYMLHRLRFK